MTATDRQPMPKLSSGGQHASEHVAIHTGHFRPILESIAEWVEARDALLAIEQLRLPPAAETPADLAEQLLADAKAGTATTKTLMAAATKAAQGGTALDIARTALNIVRGELVRDLDAAVEDNWGRLYQHVAAEHAEAWARLAAIEQPAALTDAAAAIDSNRVDDYRAFRAALADIRAIRARYVTLAKEAGGIPDPNSPEVWIRDLDRWPLYPAWVSGYTENHLGNGEVEQISPPWDLGDDTPPGSDRWILWLLETDYTAWLPTPADLAANGQDLRQHVHAWATSTEHGGNQPLTPAARRREQRTVHNQMIPN